LEINLLKYFTVKRFLNIIKIVASFGVSRILRIPVLWGMPVSYSIEPTNHCNLKCPECPSGLGTLTRRLGLLKIENLKKIVDQIKDTGFYIQLFFQGEPYINRQLPEMIKYARQQKIYTSVSTNGHFITEKNIDYILDNAPDKLIFSIDGLDEESYRNYRIGGSFKQADEGLRLIAEKKKKFKKKIPFIELQFIVMKQNEHQLEEVIKYGKNAGADKVVFKTMQVSSYENALHFLPLQNKYRRYEIKNGDYMIKSKLKNHCFAIWRTSVITWDGKIVPCCFDKDAVFTLGNLNGLEKGGIKKIWKSEAYQDFRRKILKNRKENKMCSNCTEGLKINIFKIEQ
jgi:radical SAM protein with 4Fe4S-binding SPASM domain